MSEELRKASKLSEDTLKVSVDKEVSDDGDSWELKLSQGMMLAEGMVSSCYRDTRGDESGVLRINEEVYVSAEYSRVLIRVDA